jgi:putative membrane protein
VTAVPGSSLPAYPGPADPRPDEREWHRLHPLSAVVRAGRSLVAVLIPLVLALGKKGIDVGDLVTSIVIFFAVLLLGVVSWLVTRWRMEGGVLRIDSGLIRRSSERLPLSQLQAIDIVAPGLARLFGLAELRLRMGGSSGKGGRLSYLTVADAEQLKARLLALAHGQAEDTPAPEEHNLLRVPAGRLIVSLGLGRPGAILVTAAIVLIGIAVVAPSDLGPILTGSVAFLVGLATAVWRPLNSGYHLTVAEADDGLRVRSGLIQTTAETIPFGRIQAVRLIEPILWRPFGWCRVLVDVAGKQRKSRENSAESKSLRALLPVGSRAEADGLIGRLIVGAPTERRPAPAKARWKSPLRYNKLTWAANDTHAVTTSGRLRRVTDWVPLAKVQSIRRVEGPAQRALGLASVHLDTAGRGIDATIRDREAAECDDVMSRLPAKCRAARAADLGAGAGGRPAP